METQSTRREHWKIKPRMIRSTKNGFLLIINQQGDQIELREGTELLLRIANTDVLIHTIPDAVICRSKLPESNFDLEWAFRRGNREIELVNLDNTLAAELSLEHLLYQLRVSLNGRL